MSRAFVKEDNDVPEKPAAPRLPPPLPPGAKNLLTPEGERRLRAELAKFAAERSQLASRANDDDATRQKQASLVARFDYVQQCLHAAEVVRPPAKPWDRVKFGATVTVRERSDEQVRYRIVGFHEADMEPDWISFRSPLARALLDAEVGQRVRFKVPSGEEELEVLAVTYE
jgi:transcription elongation factor GreB